MIYRTIPGLGTKPSCIGLGGWQLGGHGWGKVSQKEMVAAVHKALDLGVNFFDTAPIYGLGQSEELLGKAIAGRRAEVIIASKVGLAWSRDRTFEKSTDSSPASIHREIDASLKRLGTDYIDLYQIHWPDPNTHISDTMAAMEKVKAAGKVRLIGCCNFSLDLLKEALKYGSLASVQMPYSLVDRGIERDLLPFCLGHGIAVLAYSPIAKGLLSGKYDGAASFAPDDHRSRHSYFQHSELRQNLAIVERVKLVAAMLARTPTQVALRWVLEKGVTAAIVGAKTPAQVEENVQAFELTLPKDTVAFLDGSMTPGQHG